MPLPDIDTALDWRGRTVVDQSGEKIGKFEDIYLHEETARPEWAAVNTGLFGLRGTLVPLSEAKPAGDDIEVPFDAEHVKAAPNVDPDNLSQEEATALYRHYGLDYPKSEAPADDDAEGHEVIRSEEELEVGTEVRPRERVRLKKYLVTEPVTKTVPVTREEVRIEREPVDPDDTEGG
jgi:sporulation protein YlmC with PRC-barrel domain